MLRGTLVVLVPAALLVGGCAGDDGGVSMANDPEGVSTANDQESADEAIAAVEQSLRDDGFSARADEDDDDLVYESGECREFDEALPDDDQKLPGETARADSEDFDRGEVAPSAGVLETVGATAWLVEAPDDLDPVFELLHQRLGQCLQEAFRIEVEAAAAESQAAAEVGDIAVEELGPEGLGDAGGGVEVTGVVTVSGVTSPFSLAAQFVRVDRALVLIDIFAAGPDEPTADRAALLQVLVDGVSDQS